MVINEYKGLDSIPISTGTFNFMYLWTSWKRINRNQLPHVYSQEVSKGAIIKWMIRQDNAWPTLHIIELNSPLLSWGLQEMAFRGVLWPPDTSVLCGTRILDSQQGRGKHGHYFSPLIWCCIRSLSLPRGDRLVLVIGADHCRLD